MSSEEKACSRWKQKKASKKDKRKIKRNLGECYLNPVDKVEARQLGRPCGCRKNCRQKLGGQEISIFTDFWNMGDYNRQNAYLFSQLEVKPPQRRYPKKCKKVGHSRREHSVAYCVKLNGENIKVCKKEFLAIHGLQRSKCRVELLVKQVISGLSIAKADKRGKHSNRPNKYSEESIRSVKDHIDSIPKYTSHYSRTCNPGRIYLNSDLSVQTLYTDLYRPWCEEKQIVPVSADKYRRIFGTSYNIGFKLPRSDTCKTCDTLQNSISSGNEVSEIITKLKVELELHQRRSQAVQDYMKAKIEDAKKNDTCEVITFDLQQALATPTLTTSVAFYLRKLWTYNLGIHNCTTGKGYMNIWSEKVAKRGSEEVASVLLNYLNTHMQGTRELIVFSDNCGGQNKNWTIMSFWLQLVREKRFENIEHWFLVPGHTFLASDRDFAIIEKYKRKISHVYTTDDWAKIIKKCKKKDPFEVRIMQQEDFYGFGNLLQIISKKNTMDDKSKLDFSNARCFRFNVNEPNKMFVKHFMNEDFKPVTVTKRGRSASDKCALLSNLQKKYNSPPPIDQKKLQDLRKLLPYIPSIHQSFFTNIDDFAGADEGEHSRENTIMETEELE